MSKEIGFSFDRLDILGSFENEVHLRGVEIEDDIDEKECIIIMTREQFHKSMDCWLEDKKKYCELYNHYCGVMGEIRSSDYSIMKQNTLLIDEEYYIVDVYKINTFDEQTNMEHG